MLIKELRELLQNLEDEKDVAVFLELKLVVYSSKNYSLLLYFKIFLSIYSLS